MSATVAIVRLPVAVLGALGFSIPVLLLADERARSVRDLHDGLGARDRTALALALSKALDHGP